MTLNELRYIVAVARERHFGRAAEACYVSQPTLSVAVKKLEDELGMSLFERGHGDVSITPVGEQVVAQAQRVLEEAGALKQIARQGQDQLAGPLRLGAIYTIGPYLLPHLVSILAEQAPRMPLIIEENYTAALSEKLKQGEVDAILVSMPFEAPGILALGLYEEPFVVLMPSAHPLAARDEVSVDDIRRENVLMLGAGHCFRDQVLQLCPDCGARGRGEVGATQQTIEGGSLETIRYMVAGGLGITVLPCTAAGADRFSQRLLAIRRFEGSPPTRRVALAWRKSYPRPKAIEALRRAVLASGLSCIKPAG